MKKKMVVLLSSFLLILSACSQNFSKRTSVVLISDDKLSSRNALHRLMLYNDQIDVKGIYTEDEVFLSFYDDLIDAYTDNYENFKSKNSNYIKKFKTKKFNDLEELIDTQADYILDWSTGIEFSNLDFENKEILTISSKDYPNAEKVYNFSSYSGVFGSDYKKQDMTFQHVLNKSFFESEDVASDYWSLYEFDEGEFIGELESLTFLSLLNPDYGDLSRADKGLLSGRFEDDQKLVEVVLKDLNPYTNELSEDYSLQRNLEFIQSDFRNRLLNLNGKGHDQFDLELKEKEVTASAGDSVFFRIKGDEDLYFKWTYYQEVSDYQGDIELGGWGSRTLDIQVPQDVASGDQLHFILETETKDSKLKNVYRAVITVE